MSEKGHLLYFLDKDLLKIFFPFQTVLIPLGKSRCHYSGNRLQKPKLCNCYILFCILFVTSFFLYSIAMLYKHNTHFRVDYILLNGAYFFIFFFTSLQILISNRKGRIIKLMFEFQKVDRALGLPKCPLYYSKYTTRNVLWIILLLCFHITSFISEILLLERFQPFSFFIIITKLGVDVEVVYFLSHVVWLNSRLYIYKAILKGQKNGDGGKPLFGQPVDVTECYRHIVGAIKLVNKIWSFQLLVLYAGHFYLICRTVMIMMQNVKHLHSKAMQYNLVMNGIFLVRHFLIFYLPGVRGQELCDLLARVRVCCGDIVNGRHNGHPAEDCENVMILDEAIRPSVRIMDSEALKMNGYWPIKVFTAIAACIVVLLQLGL